MNPLAEIKKQIESHTNRGDTSFRPVFSQTTDWRHNPERYYAKVEWRVKDDGRDYVIKGSSTLGPEEALNALKEKFDKHYDPNTGCIRV